MAIDFKSKAELVTGKTGSLWSEFKNFAFKGNMIDLAVAVVIGAAFAKVIDAIVKGVIMPLISYVDFGKGGGYESWHIGRLQLGNVLAELLNFTLVALAVFIVIVKLLVALVKRVCAPGRAWGTDDQGMPQVPHADPVQGDQVRALHERFAGGTGGGVKQNAGEIRAGPSRQVDDMRLGMLCGLAFALTAGSVFGDEILFKNGDRITGKVRLVDGGKMTIDSKIGGEIHVDMNDVKTFTTDAPIEIRTKDGQRLTAKTTAGETGTVKVDRPTTGGAAQTVPISNMKYVNFNEAWTGNVVLGALYTRQHLRGSSQRRIRS